MTQTARLGIYAKTYSPPPQIDFNTGEVLEERNRRAERYALKSVVNRLLPDSRTAKCMRWRVPAQDVQIRKSHEHHKAFYTGLQVCARVWTCPVCAAKISERRRAELVLATTQAKALDLHVYLLTLTVPHGLGDDVSIMLDKMMKAWTKLNQGKSGETLKRLIGLKGVVRSLEVTHGSNGFHPHFHALLFLDTDLNTKQVEAIFSPRWQSCAERSGLPRPSDAHGCRVDDGARAAAYASKWGLESELTKSHTKTGKNGSKTPWDLLRDVLAKAEDWKRSVVLFRAYADAFKGRRQLYWSNGLRKMLELDHDLTDEDLASSIEDNAGVLASLTTQQWRAVLFVKGESDLLDIAEQCPEIINLTLRAWVSEWRRCRALACSDTDQYSD